MTIPAGALSVTQHPGNGVADTFDYEFKIVNADELLVIVTDSDGIDTTLALNTDYTVAGLGNINGGSVTLVAGALPTGSLITLQDNIQVSQQTPFGNQSSFQGILHENALDKLTRLVGQLFNLSRLSVRVPTTTDPNFNGELPKPVAGKVVVINADGSGLDLGASEESFFDWVTRSETAAQSAEDDATQTALDRVATGEDAEATALDRVATGQDATNTAADRVQTGLDRVATGEDSAAAVSAAATAVSAANSASDDADSAEASAVDAAASAASINISVYNSVAAMKAANIVSGRYVKTRGYYSLADDGNAAYLVRTAAEYAATPDEYTDHTLANGNVAVLLTDSSINVRQAGATGSGTTDDTAAIQAAINKADTYGAVYLPAGQYLVSSTLTINKSYVSVYGDGSGATEILRTDGDYGDTVYVASPTPTTIFLLSVNISKLKIRSNVEMNANAHLHLEEVTQATYDDLFLEDGFIGMLIEGGRNLQFSDSKVESGKFFTTTKTGSRFVKVIDTPNLAQKNSEISFTGFNWTFTVNDTIEYGLEVEAVDGIWFTNGHILGAALANCLIDFSGGDQITGLMFTGVWFDGFTTTNLVFSNAPGVIGKDFQFSNCVFSGADTYCVQATVSAVFDGAIFSNCSFQNCDAVGVLAAGGKVWQFSNCKFTDINRALVANSFAIQTTGTGAVEEVVVQGCQIGDDVSVLDYGVRVVDTGTEFNVTGNTFLGIQIAELGLDTGVELKGAVAANKSNRANYTQATAAATTNVTAIAESANLVGASATVNNFVPRWEGRKLAVRAAVNSQTIAHGAGTIINQSGANVSLAVNRAVMYQYIDEGNAFYQVG